MLLPCQHIFVIDLGTAFVDARQNGYDTGHHTFTLPIPNRNSGCLDGRRRHLVGSDRPARRGGFVPGVEPHGEYLATPAGHFVAGLREK